MEKPKISKSFFIENIFVSNSPKKIDRMSSSSQLINFVISQRLWQINKFASLTIWGYSDFCCSWNMNLWRKIGRRAVFCDTEITIMDHVISWSLSSIFNNHHYRWANVWSINPRAYLWRRLSGDWWRGISGYIENIHSFYKNICPQLLSCSSAGNSRLIETSSYQENSENGNNSSKNTYWTILNISPFFVRVILAILAFIANCLLQVKGWGRWFEGQRFSGISILGIAYFLLILGLVSLLLNGLVVWFGLL